MQAENSIAFFEKYGSYVISYTFGLDMVRAYFEKQKCTTEKERWNLYYRLISTPVLPEDLMNSEPRQAD